MNTLLGELGKNAKFIEILNKLEKDNRSPIEISGLNDVGMVQISTAINEFGKKPICILTYNEIQAKKIHEDLKYFTDKVVLFPKKEIKPGLFMEKLEKYIHSKFNKLVVKM